MRVSKPSRRSHLSRPTRFLLIAALLTSQVVGAASWSSADDGLEFSFEGAGWGHGVGLPQFGARGRAIADPGLSGAEIAEYYYPGTSVDDLDDLSLSVDFLTSVENPLWINLDTNRTLLTFTAVGGELDLCLNGDGEGPCPKPEHPGAGQTWTFETLPAGGCAFFHGGVQQGTAGACQAAIAWPDAVGVDVDEICGSGDVYRCRYETGEIKIRPAGSGFHISLATQLESYLRGLGELPIEWSEVGANAAQAIVSRSYAVHEFLLFEGIHDRTDLNAGVPTSCYCHMYDDARDQSFVGTQINGLDRQNLAGVWTAAVDATAGKVLTYSGANWASFTRSSVIKAFFHSSTGGWTESNVDAFGASSQFPFFVPVSDPWSVDPAAGNPHAAWSETIAADAIAGILGVDEVTSARMISPIPNAQVEFGIVDGGVSGIEIRGGGWLRTDLGLRSPSLLAIDGQGAGPPLPFDDIAASAHLDSILAILDAGITVGCDTTSFCPRESVTRGQMASFVVRAAGLAAASGDHFDDDDGNVHEENINRLFEAGITDGCAGNRFCPNADISRGQMAVFLQRALNLTESGDDAFSDDDDTPYEDAINAIASAGITEGCAAGRYCPYAPVTRGQMASLLERAFLPD